MKSEPSHDSCEYASRLTGSASGRPGARPPKRVLRRPPPAARCRPRFHTVAAPPFQRWDRIGNHPMRWLRRSQRSASAKCVSLAMPISLLSPASYRDPARKCQVLRPEGPQDLTETTSQRRRSVERKHTGGPPMAFALKPRAGHPPTRRSTSPRVARSSRRRRCAGVDEVAATDVHTHVPEEEDEIARLQLILRHCVSQPDTAQRRSAAG